MIPAGLNVEEAARRAGLEGRDEEVRDALEAAVANCATFTSRTLSPAPADGEAARTVVVHLRGSQYIRVPDLRRVVSVTLDGVELDLDAVELIRSPDRSEVPAHKLRAPFGGQRAEVVGWFGFDGLPDDLLDAIYTDTVQRARDHNGGAPGGYGADGTILYPRALAPRVYATFTRYAIDDSGALV